MNHQKMVTDALSQDLKKRKSFSKKIVSGIVSVCTAFTKPRNDLGFEQWQHIEFKKLKSDQNFDQQNSRSM